jgi:hypothetical protein
VVTARERELEEKLKASEKEVQRLRKFERWYIVGEIRVRRALRQHPTGRKEEVPVK